MRIALVFLALASSLVALAATPQGDTAPAAAAPAAPTPVTFNAKAKLPPGLDDAALDRKTAPCVDFYRFACGGWLDKTKIADDRANASRGFVDIADRNELILKDILERAAKGKLDTPIGKLLRDHYATCMDEKKLEGSLSIVTERTKELGLVNNGPSLAQALGRLHGMGVNAVFNFESMQDLRDAQSVVGGVFESGLGMPDRDYYLSDDEKMTKVRDLYRKHIQTMGILWGMTPEQAMDFSDRAFAVEKRLASATRTRVEKRDIQKMYNRLDREGLRKAAPSFDWNGYLSERGQRDLQAINVAHPPYLAEIQKMVNEVKPQEWGAYLSWAYLRAMVLGLPKKMQEERFAYESAALTGAKADRPRWKKCVAAADGHLGEALGQVFVDEHFGKDGKERTLAMVIAVEQAFEANLESLSWMDAQTKEEAKQKAKLMSNKIGYPDKWRDYTNYVTARDSFLTNIELGNTFAVLRDMNKIGKPIDKNEWHMSPPTVNAYNDGQNNEIVFPAGILQPPFFNKAAPDAVNFGAMGMVVGHEITHGFDDEGRKLDKAGNLRDWWSKQAGEQFEQKTQCLVKQYDESIALEDLHVNGKLTLGENTADLGGVKLAHQAMRTFQQKRTEQEKAQQKTSSYTEDQLFFLGFAQSWCAKYRPENARMRVKTDPHAPPFLRVNNTVQNLPSFAEAFGCKAGDPMVRATRCEVW